MTHSPPNTAPLLSVVMCARNPRPDVLARAWAHLTAQTLPRAQWEVVLVDNGSVPPIELEVPPGLACRRLVEPAVGLTNARLRGIREAVGELLVFVDDDNLLAADYLATALHLAEKFPLVGVFGGRILPEFPTQPTEWLRPFFSHLALTDFVRDEWSNLGDDRAVIPCGAGLCIRREPALAYAAQVTADPRRRGLDRNGNGTMSCGDTDMVLTCIDEGWGSARFTALQLTHVIPASRLDFGYQRRLARDIGYSYGRLLALRGRSTRGRRMIGFGKTVLAFLGVKHRGRARSLDVAYHHGYWRGLRSDCS